MTEINNIDQLSLPDLYKDTLIQMIKKLQKYPVVKDIILFGSCARQNISQNSDIDLALVVSEPITADEEWDIDYSIRHWESNLACDIIFIPDDYFYKPIIGDTVVRPLLQEGIRLNGLLH